MSAAQVTEAHRELARRIMFEFTQVGTATASDVRMAAQIIADSEARACDQLRAEVERLTAGWDKYANMQIEMDALFARAERAEAEVDAQCILNGKGAEREADLLGKVERAERELAAEREKMMVLKLDKDRLDWWNGEPHYQFGKSHKCMNPGWWWSCGFESGMHGKSGIKNIRDAIDSAMAHSKSGRNKYNVRIEESAMEDKP